LKQIKNKKCMELAHSACKLALLPNDPTLLDVKDSFVFCDYHYTGGFYESMGDYCPCQCYCKNCEMIPEDAKLIRAQEIAEDMTEENVFNEFIRQYGKGD